MRKIKTIAFETEAKRLYLLAKEILYIQTKGHDCHYIPSAETATSSDSRWHSVPVSLTNRLILLLRISYCWEET